MFSSPVAVAWLPRGAHPVSCFPWSADTYSGCLTGARCTGLGACHDDVGVQRPHVLLAATVCRIQQCTRCGLLVAVQRVDPRVRACRAHHSSPFLGPSGHGVRVPGHTARWIFQGRYGGGPIGARGPPNRPGAPWPSHPPPSPHAWKYPRALYQVRLRRCLDPHALGSDVPSTWRSQASARDGSLACFERRCGGPRWRRRAGWGRAWRRISACQEYLRSNSSLGRLRHATRCWALSCPRP